MMTKEAHIIVALLLVILIYFIGGYFFVIPTLWLQYTFSFLLGAIGSDLLEPGGRGLWHHRGMIHSKGFTKVLFFFIIPITIFYSIQTSPVYFHLTALSFGLVFHNVIDSTSRLSWGKI